MNNGHFSVNRPFTLSWNIRIHDMAVDTGFIRFGQVLDTNSFVGDEDEGAGNAGLQVIEVSPSWKDFALPIFINEMVLADTPAPGYVYTGPAYEEATFKNDAFWFEAWWSLKGCGFGSFYVRTIQGTPHIDNECMGKVSIKQIFDLIQLPQGETK